MEIWKDVKGFEDILMVSNLGNLKSKDRYVNNNGTLVLKKGIKRKAFVNGSGYLQVSLSKNGNKYYPYVHKLVAENFIKNNLNLKEVNHIDHDKLNCKVENLEWCTRQYNINKMHEFYGTSKIQYYCINDACENEIYGKNTYCYKCRVNKKRSVNRASKQELNDLIYNLSFLKIGKIFNVSDNTIRNWCKYYNLPYRKKDLK